MYLEKEEMKFAAVYAIRQYKAPIAESRLYEIFTWDKDIMEYFDLSASLAELLEDGYIIKKFYRNEEALCLSDKGDEAFLFFKERVPFSIRARIDSAIGRIKYDELADPNAIRGEVVLAAEEQYMAKCRNCGAEIPDGAELCDKCAGKINTAKNSESYLDSLLSAVMTEDFPSNRTLRLSSTKPNRKETKTSCATPATSNTADASRSC